MFRKGLMLAALLALAPAVASADFEQGDVELTLGATASNGPDFDGFTAGGNAGLGFFMTDELELGIRQSVSYSDIGVGSALNGSTRVFLDYHFDLGQWQPFVGANFGYVYGDAVADTFEAAPEGGVKYFVNSTTFVYALAEYQFFFDEAEQADDTFSNGQFIYSLGIGVKF